MSLHDNCIDGWIVYTQAMPLVGGGWGESRTTGDIYTDKAQASRSVEAFIGPWQHAWMEQVRVHLH